MNNITPELSTLLCVPTFMGHLVHSTLDGLLMDW